MPSKLRIVDGRRFLGYATLYDAEPSFDVLLLAFPDAQAFIWRARDNQFTVDVGDAQAPADES